jgi:glycosyltransferase involved in cell wall biosynthesis
MLVSAVVSTYNAQRFIRGRLQNLIDQTLYQKGLLEIIVVDSGSQEDEASIVQEFSSKNRNIYYLRTQNRETVYRAWNRGIAVSRGRYFINANTDDRFVDDALEKLADVLEKQPTVDAAYGDWLYTETENDHIDSSSPKKIYKYPEFYPPLLFYHQFTSHALMIRSSAFPKVGLFNARMEVFGDRDWVFRFSLVGRKAVHIQKSVGLYLKRADSLERTSRDFGEKEFNSLLRYYQELENFFPLHGYENLPVNRELAQLYAMTGALGIHFVANDGLNGIRLPSQSLIFFRRALALDQGNLMASNNLAVAAALQGGQKFAVESFLRLLECKFLDWNRLNKNLEMAQNRSQDITKYHWYHNKHFCIKNN